MDFKNKFKRSGFTLMEIVIAVFIVAILVAVTIPIIKKQLDKADEYSYFLAYKTVEKMAGQIVAMGDPEEINDITLLPEDETKLADKMKNSVKTFIADSGKKVKIFFTTANNKFARAEEYMFRKMFPKAFAEYITSTSATISSSSFDSLWLGLKVCSLPDGSNTYVKGIEQSQDPTTGAITNHRKYYKHSDFDNCIGYGKAGKLEEVEISKWYQVQMFFPEHCPRLNLTTAANEIIAQSSPDASAFQSTFNNMCSGTENREGTTYTYTTEYKPLDTSGNSTEGSEEEETDIEEGDENLGDLSSDDETPETPDDKKGDFVQKEGFNMPMADAGMQNNTTEKPAFAYTYCDAKMGTFNMINQNATPTTPGTSVDCVCNSSAGYSSLSVNNDRACCKPCADTNAVPYYNKNASTTAKKCVCCSTDFNPVKGECCPKNSIYVDGNTCTCISGYGPPGVCNEVTDCPPGTTQDPIEKVCVVNPPVIKASRFCEMIKDYYNISSANCNAGFKTLDIKGKTVNYNEDVYHAALGTNNNYLSIAAKSGAFGLADNNQPKIKPNIVFSNGLPMWILADKAASIAGLTYTTSGISKTQNLCVNLRKHTPSACKNVDDKAYFCKSENTCFTLDDDSLTNMGDARNCCAAADLATLAAVTQTDPNYNKDDYKKDKRSYAISGFTVFVDINGLNKGSGTLWEDVFPFYIGANGTVYPAYPLDAPKAKDHASNALYLAGNSEKQLAVDVYYYESAGAARKKVMAFPNVSYARGICSARQISKYSPYCMNVGEKFVSGSDYLKDDDPTSATNTNPCDKHRCYVAVKQKLRSF